MEIHEQHHDDILIVRMNGPIDTTTGPLLGDRLDALINHGHVNLVIDLSDVPYITSAGLRVLSVALKAVRTPDSSGDLCLTNLSRTVAHAFKISGFDQVFSIYDTVSEAIDVMVATRQFDLEIGE